MLAVGEHLLGHLEPQAAGMATGLAGGLGGTYQEMCGALSGGVLVIGALYGRHRLPASDEPAYSLAARYRKRFLAEFGATQCAQIRSQVEAPGGPDSCAEVVEKAALLLLDLLDSTVTDT
ncbi:MAG: C-GCAxxG-C-C family protein [Anaerolineae bacterium]